VRVSVFDDLHADGVRAASHGPTIDHEQSAYQEQSADHYLGGGLLRHQDLPSDQCLNVDNGQEYCGYDYDLVTPLASTFIGPGSGAKSSELGAQTAPAFHELDASALQSLTYGADPIQQPEVGEVFAVKTARGNYAKVQVVANSPVWTLDITTYGPSA
jgi:hypothetical protein